MNIVEYAKMRKMFGGGSGGDIDALIDRSITEISYGGESVGEYAFRGCTQLESMDFPNVKVIGDGAFYGLNMTNVCFPKVTSVGGYAFCYCNYLASVDFPLATSIGDYAFYKKLSYTDKGTQNVMSVNFPIAETIGKYAFADDTNSQYSYLVETAHFPKVKTVGDYAFYKNGRLKSAYFPEATQIGQSAFGSNQGFMKLTKAFFPKLTTIGFNPFYMCAYLKTLDLGLVSSLGSWFSHGFSLQTLVLRKETLCSLGSTSAFSNCYHFNGTTDATYNPDGLKDGYIYVPRALIEDYKVATNWVTFADRFRALEDYTVDGTTTGELDESKVSL